MGHHEEGLLQSPTVPHNRGDRHHCERNDDYPGRPHEVVHLWKADLEGQIERDARQQRRQHEASGRAEQEHGRQHQ